MLSDLSYYAFSKDDIPHKIATYVREHPTETRAMLAQLRGYGATPTQAQVSQAQIALTDFYLKYPSDTWDTLSADQLAYVKLHIAALETIIAQRQGPTAVLAARSKLAQAEATNNLRVAQQRAIESAPSWWEKLTSSLGQTATLVALGGAALIAFAIYTQSPHAKTLYPGGGNRTWK